MENKYFFYNNYILSYILRTFLNHFRKIKDNSCDIHKFKITWNHLYHVIIFFISEFQLLKTTIKLSKYLKFRVWICMKLNSLKNDIHFILYYYVINIRTFSNFIYFHIVIKHIY